MDHVTSSQEAQELWMGLRGADTKEELTPSSGEEKSHPAGDKASLYIARLLEDIEFRMEEKDSGSTDRPPPTNEIPLITSGERLMACMF